MNSRLVLVVAFTMLTVPLVGCIGQQTDEIGSQSAEDPTQEVDTPGNPAQAYVADGDSATEIDAEDVLAEGVPAPSGIDRHMDLDEENVFEPTIGVTSEGNIFVSNLGGSAGTDYSSLLRSTDDGETWEDVTGSVGPVSSPPQSNDPYVYVDEETDRIYNLDMQGLQGNYIRWSDDEGETWTPRPQAGETPVLDHPTLFAGDPTTLETTAYENVVYLCVNRVADSACTTSLDGGVTWRPFTTVYPGADQGVASEAEGFCGGLHAHGTTGPNGTAYLPKGHCGLPTVAVSTDDGATWQLHEISTEVEAGDHEVAIATDDEGTVYAFWYNDDNEGYLAHSTDKGQTWSDPVNVDPPGTSLTQFPTIAATGDGSVALSYVATTDDIDSFEDADEETTWNAYITTVTNATSEEPAFLTTTANDPEDPIARGNCNSGNRCFGDEGGSLGDFIDVVIDDDGRPWAALVDTCTEDCVDDPSAGRDVGVGFVGTVNQGPSLEDPTQALDPLVTPDDVPNATGDD
ncbi:hypothetical protein BRD56_01470 [Thermoplasmatales archaeon SW_10_69_26]|nr:MAG: hypothetical protein BRD56_01470 [Thermoplasmatales archaeon SW_10_69_26]